MSQYSMAGLPNSAFCYGGQQHGMNDHCNNDMQRIRDGSCGWNTGQYHYGGGGVGWATVDLGEPVAVGAVKVNGYQHRNHRPSGNWEVRGTNDGTEWTTVGVCP